MRNTRNKKLNKLRKHLSSNGLAEEANLLISMQVEFSKIARVTDESLNYKKEELEEKNKNNQELDNFVSDILSDPEIIDNISLCAKICAALIATSGYGAGVSVAILQGARVADLYSAALYANQSDWVRSVLSLISAIVVVPNKQLYKVYDFILSDKFIKILSRFKNINNDQSWLYASYIADFFRYSVPIFLDKILGILGDLLSNLEHFADAISYQIKKNKEDILNKLKNTINNIIISLKRIESNIGY